MNENRLETEELTGIVFTPGKGKNNNFILSFYSDLIIAYFFSL